MKKPLFFAICLFFFGIPTASFAASNVQLVSNDASINFHPLGETYLGNVTIDAVDLGTDEVEEIIIGSGPGVPPYVKIFQQDGTLITEFLAYAETFQGGISATACDVNGDGKKEIITGTQNTGGPHVRIFYIDGTPLYNGGFFAYATDFRGGVNVSCGDIDGDGIDDIVTGPGLSGGPHVKVFSADGVQKFEIFAGSASENTGASIATGDVNGDGDAEIITGRMGAGDASVYVIDEANNKLTYVSGFDAFPENKNGINVSTVDVDGDGKDEISTSTRRDNLGRVRMYEMNGYLLEELSPFSEEHERGVTTTAIRIAGKDTLLSASTTARSSDQVGKYIHVDVGEQRLYAYENGALAKTFLVSTGTYSHPTPLGKTEVTDKIPVHRYTWSYGPENPNNYDLPGVKWNLRFRQHYYIHSAYWHNNFGNRMSHGCVNVDMENAEWIYNWTDVGTVVEITD